MLPLNICVVVVFDRICIRYKVVLDSDAEQYNGHKRIDPNVEYHTAAEPWDNRSNNMHVCCHLLLYTSC